jgi:hypothetical protein
MRNCFYTLRYLCVVSRAEALMSFYVTIGGINMKTYLIILSLLLFPVNLWAACTGSSPTWNCTADSTASQINSCLSSASGGDTINIGSGTVTLNGTLAITKGIHLKGAGSGSTTMTCSTSSAMISIIPANQSLNSEYEITGFGFNVSNRCKAITLGNYTSSAPTTFNNKVNIHENTFIGNTTYNSNNQYIYNYNMGGVVWKNIFTGADQHIRSNGYGVDNDPIWDLIPNSVSDMGKANALYIEDNIFNYNALGDAYLADCQFAGVRRVWRYNTINSTGDFGGNGVADFHGPHAANYGSCYGDEAYGNKAIMTNNDNITWFSNRGGKSVVFYNDAITSGDVAPARIFAGLNNYCPTTDVTAQVMRSYFWNNRKNTTTAAGDGYTACGSGECNYSCDGTSNYPAENWNYFNYKTSGTTGVRCGSSLPTITTEANRVGFWLTNQSCSSVGGLVGDIINNPTRGTISGTLYIVSGGSWVSVYTPYTYPHPLRSGEGVITPPHMLQPKISGISKSPWRHNM